MESGVGVRRERHQIGDQQPGELGVGGGDRRLQVVRVDELDEAARPRDADELGGGERPVALGNVLEDRSDLTASNSPSAKGRARMSAARKSTSTPTVAAASRAVSTEPGSRSIPATRPPGRTREATDLSISIGQSGRGERSRTTATDPNVPVLPLSIELIGAEDSWPRRSV